MAKTIFFIIILLSYILPVSAHAIFPYARFLTKNWQDKMTDTKIYEQYTRNNSEGRDFDYDHFGYRCSIKGVDKIFLLTFSAYKHIATPNSDLEIMLRIDGGKVHHIKGRTFNNSYKAGVMVPNISLIDDLKTGKILLMNIYVYDELKLGTEFSLNGSSDALESTAGICGELTNNKP